MADLKVDFENLESSKSTVASLKAAFDGLSRRVSAQSRDWGSSDIEGAMHEFATNWDYRRDILSGKLKEVGEKIEGTLEAFTEADEKLAHGLEQGMHGSEGGQ